MPEGHTLHRIARDLHAAFAGAPARFSSPQGRFAAGAALLDGGEVIEARAHGKHLFVEVSSRSSRSDERSEEPREDQRVLHVHLGLIGTFTIDAAPYVGERPVVGMVRLRIENDAHVADLRGPMTCAVITPDDEAAVHAKLGPDPLRDESGDDAWAKITRSKKSIAALLMDQGILAGVGNVYRCEVLFRHGIDPMTSGNRLRRESWAAIWADLRRLLPLGVATSRIVTLPEQVEQIESALAKGEEVHLTERDSFVYKRTGEPCLVCGTPIAATDVAGRTLCWCASCQRGW